MKRFVQKGIVLCLLWVAVVPTASAAAPSAAADAVYRAALLELIVTLQQQIAALQAELTGHHTTVSTIAKAPSHYANEIETIVTYELSDPVAVTQIADSLHRAYFMRVFALFPAEYEQRLQRVRVFGGDETSFDAFVETISPEHTTWQYAVHEDMLEDPDSAANTELIVHEFAHVIAYEAVLGVPRLVTAICHDYFEVHGCPSRDSYLAQFVRQFWSGTDLDRAERFTHARDLYDTAYSYYQDHETEYVSDYAAIAPEEDFAESFMYYVLDLPVTGSVAQEKVAFFATFKKMRAVKVEMVGEV